MNDEYKLYQEHKNGLRFYKVIRQSDGEVIGNIPSATTILGETADKSGIEKWKNRVGHEEADRINRLSRHRGTVMHRLIELFKPLKGSNKEKYNQLVNLAKEDPEILRFEGEENKEYLQGGWEFFNKFYQNSDQTFDRVQSVLANEEALWTLKKGGWAGTVDNVSLMDDNRSKIIDYKNARKPKKESWVEDYFQQLACYWLARWDLFGLKAQGAEIWLVHEQSNDPQIFTLTETDLKHYLIKFIKRRNEFYRIFNI